MCLHLYIYFKVCVFAYMHVCFFISFNFNRENLAEKINAPGRDERNIFSVLFLLLFFFMYVYVLLILQEPMTPGSFNQIQG